MRNLFKLVVLFLFIAVGTQSFAQPKYKFGHIDVQRLLGNMPGRDSMELVLQRYAKDLQEQLETMKVEFNNKFNDYSTKKDSLSEPIKQLKETELQDLQERMKNFQNLAQENLQKKEAELFKPVLDKAQKAINVVAEENKFTYIFNVSGDAALYANIVLFYSKDSEDIMPLVKAKLGIKK